MRSHSVTCHLAEVTFPPLPQPKLVLDLATPEGCKAELTWVVVSALASINEVNLRRARLILRWATVSGCNSR